MLKEISIAFHYPHFTYTIACSNAVPRSFAPANIFQKLISMEPIRNKVAESGIITIDPATFIPAATAIEVFDLQPMLFRGLILREKDYRAALQAFDWSIFEGKHAAVFCSTDAIIPVWAFMLAATYLTPVAASVHFGDAAVVREAIMQENIAALQADEYTGKRIVLKGCGDVPVPDSAYVTLTTRLRPFVKSIMYGEPCSTVPVYKQQTAAVNTNNT